MYVAITSSIISALGVVFVGSIVACSIVAVDINILFKI